MKPSLQNILLQLVTLLLPCSVIPNYLNAQQTIYSVASGSWHNPFVWSCSCVPSESDDVIINQYNFILISDSAVVNNLEIYPNGELNMTGYHVLDVNGNIDAVGLFNISEGQLLLTGLNDQYVDAAENELTFKDVTIDNINNYPVTFYNGNYQLTGKLTPVNGGMILDNFANNTFTFSSLSETINAQIAPVQNSFYFEGKYTVERQIPAGPTDIRTISAAVKNGIFTDWNLSVGMYGNTLPDGCVPWLDTCINSVNYTYNGITTGLTDITDSALVGVGYEMYLGTDSILFTGATISMTGTLNDNIDIESTVGSGWDTKGNPYVSAIDFNDLARSGVANFFYVYSAESGSFEWYDGSNNTSSSSEIANGIIASGQGFYVSGPGTITFSDSAKTDQSAAFIKTDSPDMHSFLLSLSRDNSQQQCKMSFAVDQSTTDGYDQGKDIPHLMNGNEKGSSIGVNDNGFLIRKNYFNSETETKIFQLFSRINKSGDYTISLYNFEHFVDYNSIELHDNYTGETFNLKKGNYHFYSEAGDFNRFTLILSNTTLQTTESDSKENSSFQINFHSQNNLLEINNLSNFEHNSSIYMYTVSGSMAALKLNQILTPGVNYINLPETNGIQLIIIETENGRFLHKTIL